jgi:hypothetical protein
MEIVLGLIAGVIVGYFGWIVIVAIVEDSG